MSITVIAFLATQASGAAGAPQSSSADSRARSLAANRVTAPVHTSGATRRASPRACSARKAVEFYAGRIVYWHSKMGAVGSRGTAVSEASGSGPASMASRCPRYLAHVLQRKAYGLRRAFERYRAYHYDWMSWLPDKWARIGACETGYGRRPGRWDWDSGTYVSAFGIYRAGYSQFAHAIGQLSWDETRSRMGRYPTPREQWNVALEIYRRYGFSGWGCRNA